MSKELNEVAMVETKEDAIKPVEQAMPIEMSSASHQETSTASSTNYATVDDVVNEWAQSSTIHGMSHVFDKEHYRLQKRVAWAVLILVAFGWMMYVILTLLSSYKKYEVNTDSVVSMPAKLSFPVVTICNVFQYYIEMHPSCDGPKTEEELYQIAQPLEEFIVYTTYNQAYVNITERWVPVITPFGMCYQFQTDEQVSTPGFLSGGLRVMMDLQQNQLCNNVTGEMMEGVRIYVTQPGAMITEQDSYELASPGMESLMSIEQHVYSRIVNEPKTRCKKKEPAEYTQNSCRSRCVNADLESKCGCQLPGLASTVTAKTLPFCVVSDFLNCEDEFSDIGDLMDACLAGEKGDDYDCSLPLCDEKVYPSKMMSTRTSAEGMQIKMNLFNMTEDYIDRNIVHLVINYESMQEEIYTESRKMSKSDLVSQIGGTMGLFMGISLLSIYEVLGDLCAMRLIPRLFGNRNLYGIGTRHAPNGSN